MAESEVRQKVFNEVTKAIEGKQDLDAFYTDLQSAGPNDEVSAELIDVFWVLWLKLDGSSQKMKLVELMKDCIRDKKIDKKAAMETLEHDCMQAVGIIPDVDMWKKKEIRFSTKINYTQTKYNLLREDSEGYAKLVTALNQFGTACLVDDMVPMLAKEIQALIGYFDLDPNRCLDLVLEAAEQQPTNSATIKLIPMFKRDAVVHLLGFKFQQHQKPEADPVWPNLYNLAARLVQEGLVGLDELLGHLAPSDAAIKSAQEATKHALQKEVDNIGVISLVGGNGPQTEVKDFREHQELTRAAAAAAGSGNHQQRLEREAAMVAAQRAEQQKRIGISAAQLNLDPSTTFERLLLDPEAAHNQKLGLLQALAEIGAWPEANTLLQRLVSLGVQPAAFQPFCATLCTGLVADIEPTYAVVCPKGIHARPIFNEKPANASPAPPLPDSVFDVLGRLGMFISRDVRLFTKVIRVLRHDALFHCPATPEGKVHRNKITEAILLCLLPGSALVPAMPALSNELWLLMKLFPFETRYKLYADLKEMIEKTPYLMAASKLAVYETRKILKRLYMPPDRREKKEACKPHGRMLAKVACANPISVHETIMFTVESYSNQIEPVIEALKFMTPMCFDVLTHVLLSRLSMDRDKVKDDGIHISDWLKSIAEFTGAVCRKYQEMELSALCQYLANTLRAADSMDLLVLKELVSQLTGITGSQECSDTQVESMGGGPLLQERTMVRDVERSSKAWGRGARRLLEALQRGAPPQHLALPMLILIAQQRQIIMVRTEAMYIKFVVELYDKCQETCLQYIEFLKAALPFEEYVRLLPPIEVLRQDYSLDSDVLFLLFRPILQQLMFSSPEAEPSSVAVEEMEEGEEPQAAEEGAVTKEPAPVCEPLQIGGLSWPKLNTIVRTVFAPSESMWDSMSPELYSMFWTLSLPDIFVPVQRYEAEMAAAQAELNESERQLGVLRNQPPPMAGPSYEKFDTDVMEQRKSKARAQEMLDKLPIELAAAKKHFIRVKTRLERDKTTLLANVKNKKGVAPVLVQECVMPRLLFSPTDALYCAKFAALIHSSSVPYFSTVWYYNELLKGMIPILKCITDREATNLGIFLLETLKLLAHWRSTEAIYKEECEKMCGFGISLTELDDRKTSYGQYKVLLLRWHQNCLITFRSCLDNSEWTSRRNALHVLTRIVSVFPVVDQHALILRKAVEKVRDSDEREDLKVLSKSYLACLEKESTKPGRLVTVVTFGGPTAKPGVKRAAAASTATASATAVASDSPAKAAHPAAVKPPVAAVLRAAAKPFVPTATAAAAPEGATAKAPSNSKGHSAKGEGEGHAPAAEERSVKRVKVESASTGAVGSSNHDKQTDKQTEAQGRGDRGEHDADAAANAAPSSQGGGKRGQPSSSKDNAGGSEKEAAHSKDRQAPGATPRSSGSREDKDKGSGESAKDKEKGNGDKDKDKGNAGKDKDKDKGDKEARGNREAARVTGTEAAPADSKSDHRREKEEKEERREEKKRDQSHTDDKDKSGATAAPKDREPAKDPEASSMKRQRVAAERNESAGGGKDAKAVKGSLPEPPPLPNPPSLPGPPRLPDPPSLPGPPRVDPESPSKRGSTRSRRSPQDDLNQAKSGGTPVNFELKSRAEKEDKEGSGGGSNSRGRGEPAAPVAAGQGLVRESKPRGGRKSKK